MCVDILFIDAMNVWNLLSDDERTFQGKNLMNLVL